MSNIVRPADLRPGDVFLYHGNLLISKLIRLFDATDYSHSSIWTGTSVVEAVADGVRSHSLESSVSDSEYVHVYRFRSRDGKILGAPPQLDPDKVTAVANEFVKEGHRYGYEQIMLLALLASTRRVTAPIPFLGQILRNVLDSAADALANLAALGREPMICSEMVYRCFEVAGSDYRLAIRGADQFAAGLSVGEVAGPVAKPQDDGGYSQAATAFLANYAMLKNSAAAGEMMSDLAMANFVSPGDLSKSPNLQLAGRIQL